MNELYSYLSKKLKTVTDKQKSPTQRDKGIAGVTYIEDLIDHKLRKRSNSPPQRSYDSKSIKELEFKMKGIKNEMERYQQEMMDYRQDLSQVMFKHREGEAQSVVNSQQSKINQLHITELNKNREDINSIQHQQSINKIT